MDHTKKLIAEDTMESWNTHREFDRDLEVITFWVWSGRDVRMPTLIDIENQIHGHTLDSTLAHLKELALMRKMEMEREVH